MFRGGKVPGYDPPISLALAEFQNGVEEQLGNGVMEYLCSIDIHVDKEELIKALQYDRGQYEKGFRDGVKSTQKYGNWHIRSAYLTGQYEKGFRDGVKSTQKYGNWHIRSAYLTEPADSPLREYYMECSECGRKVEGISVEDAINYRKLCRQYPYCHCGAKMDGGNEDE